MSGRDYQGRGRTTPGRGRGDGRGSGGRGRGVGRTYSTRDDSRNLWEKMGKINFKTSLLTLQRACFEYAKHNYPSIASVFKEQKYIIEDMPSREKLENKLLKMKNGDLEGALGFENAVFRAKLAAERRDEEEEEDEYKAAEADEERAAAAADAEETPEETGLTKKTINKMFEQLMLDWNKKLTKMSEDKMDMSYDLFEQCDNAVKVAMRANEHFEDIERAGDALLMFILLNVTLSSGGFKSPEDQKVKVEEDFMLFNKYPGSNLIDFKDAFDIHLKKLELVGTFYTDREKAHAFIRKLDSRYDELKKNQARTGTHMGAQFTGPRFKDLSEAFAGAQGELLVDYSAGTPKTGRERHERGNREGVAFTARGAGGREGGRGRGGRGGGRGRGGEEKPDSAENGTKSAATASDKTITCFYCKGKGHKQEDCSSTDYDTRTCYNCEGIGHIATTCASASRKA
jgi:hypothetical protein